MLIVRDLPSRLSAWVIVVLILGACATEAFADQRIIGGMTWMTQFPSTWNAGAPKVVSDGLHQYAAICGYGGSSSYCLIARRRGAEAWQMTGHRLFMSNQPAVLVIDGKGRLNVFFNDPHIRHFRFDHPSVDLVACTQISVPFESDVAYLHASYDVRNDVLMLSFNETAGWGLKFATKQGDAGSWAVHSMPASAPGTMLLYARTLRTQTGRYMVLAGEHVTSGANASYTGALLFESAAPAGPWTTRVLRRVFGNNLGIPYQNWVLANDLQADSSGRVRALLHITENGSGHSGNLDGLYILREEDNYVPRLIGTDIEDGFTLAVDPSGVHVAFGRAEFPHLAPGQVVPSYTGNLVSFQSTDNGATWGPRVSQVESAVNPTLVQSRDGSMPGGSSLTIIYSHETRPAYSYDEVWSRDIDLGIPQTATRYDRTYADDDGTVDRVRAYQDAAAGRYYYFVYDYETNGSFTVNYRYSTANYCASYLANSAGAYRYYDSDGFQASVGAPAAINSPFDDGVHTIHLRGLCRIPARVTGLRLVPPPLD